MSSTNPAEYRHMRTGSLNIPPQNGHSSGMMSPLPSAQRFDGPRSPPNTSHVPCKFFRQGACQAGNACPFSHDLGAAAENICKYFAKGNCKFGPKCANIHVLPDGRRINYGKNGVTVGGPPVALGARVNPNTYHQPSNSALTNSFLRADAISPYTASGGAYGISQDDKYSHPLVHRASMENGLPTIDTTYSSNPTSVYGSPRDDETNRFGLGLSPITKGLSVMDAPLPASFDSNGISHAARYGPWPSSVPSKFGLESPSQSLNAAKDGRTSETLKLLHTSAFGTDHLSPSAFGTLEANGFGSSPSTGSGSQALGGEEYFAKRTMHSALRFAKARFISSSAPKVDRDWEGGFLFEEDMVPGALANEVLTPAEKARRGSTTNTLRPGDGLESLTESVPISTKFGSPVTGGSPSSRWGPLFQRQKEEEAAALDMNNGSYGASSRPFKQASAFGHVGSPLRNSSLASGITAELNGDSRPGLGNESLSVLTQQLQRTRLSDDGSGNSSPHLHPQISRNPSGNGLGSIGSGIIGKEREKERGLERHVSSGSIGSTATSRFNPIHEEDPSFVFNMEEVEEAELQQALKRNSEENMATTNPLSSGWSYAAAAAGSRNPPNAVSSNSTRNGSSAVEAVGGR